jgi:hypothetical protein
MIFETNSILPTVLIVMNDTIVNMLGNIYYHECYHEQESITIIIDQKRAFAFLTQ